MSHLVLVRHGESQFNVQNRRHRIFCGQTDTPLTARGVEQARTVGRMLAIRDDLRLEVAVSSALSRCQNTLEGILAELPIQPRRLPDHAGLNERSLGDFEGRRDVDVFAEHPRYRDDPAWNQFDNHFTQKAPGGESLEDVTRRAWAVVESARRSCSGDLLLVSHFTTIRCILGRALGLPRETVQGMKVPNATPIVLFCNGRCEVIEGGDRLGL